MLRRLDYGDRDRGAVAGRLLAALGHDLEFGRVGRAHALAADLVDLLAIERDSAMTCNFLNIRPIRTSSTPPPQVETAQILSGGARKHLPRKHLQNEKAGH